MAIGRISGPLLKENLLRDEVNLAFETNLLYLDVNTHADDVSTNPGDPSLWTGRVGIRNTNPAYPLDVTGTFRATTILGGELDIDEVLINDNTISSQIGDLVISAATASDKVTFNSNVLVNGDLHATGSITADGSLQLGNEDTDNVVFAADINSDFMPNVTDTFNLGGTDKRWRRITVQSAELGDVFIENNEISTSLSNGNLVLSGNGSGSVVISGPSAFNDTTINGSFTVNGSTDLNGPVDISQTLTVGQTLNVGSVINTDNIRISGNRIETTESNSNLELVTNGSGYIDLKENTVVTGTLTVSNTVSAPDAAIPLINSSQINADQANIGDIEIDTNVIKTTRSNADLELTANGTGTIELLKDTNVNGTFDVSGQTTLASANVEDLTDGRVVLAGVNGELEDNANLTFDGTLLTVTGDISVSNNVTIGNNTIVQGDLTVQGDTAIVGNTTQQGNFSVTGTLTVTGDILGGPLRTDDIQIVGNKVETTQSNSNLEFDAAGTGTIELLTDTGVTGTFDVSGQTTLASVNVQDLTAGRVVLAGVNGELEDSTNLTFDGNELIVTGDITVTGDLTVTDNADINNDLTVGGSVAISGDATHSGNVTVDKNLTVTGDVFAGPINTDDIRIAGNRIETTQSNSNLELDTLGSGSIELLTDSRVTGTFEVTGNSVFGTTDTDTIDIKAEFVSDLVPDVTDTYDLGTAAKRWNQLHAVTADIGDVAISGTTIESTALNSDLYINANGSGNVVISNLLSLGSGGSLSFSGDTVNFNNILIDGDGDYSVIRTIDSNTSLYLDAAGTGTINLTSNTNIVGNLDVTGDISLGGNIRIGDQNVDTVTVIADFTSDLIPDASNTYDLGSAAKQWRVIHASEFDNGVVNINDNVITTTVSNSNLELRASGTGVILIPNNDVTVFNDFIVNGTATFVDVNATGDLTVTQDLTVNGVTQLNNDLTLVGDLTQTGNYTLTGALSATEGLTTSTVQTDDIRVESNVITTTQSNSNLELRANGTGTIELEESTNITGTLDVSSQATFASANVEDLTSGRIVLAGTSGELEDSANLTFDGSLLTVKGTLLTHGDNIFTGETFATGNIYIHNTVVAGDIDYVTFTTGLAPVTALYLTKYVSVDQIAFFAIQEGATWTAGFDTTQMLTYSHFGPGVTNYAVGDNVLKPNNVTLLPNTTYTMWIQQTGVNLTEYIFSTDPNYTSNVIPADYSDDINSPTVLGFSSTQFNIEGDLIVTRDITTSTVQTDDIRVEGNVITTTQSNSNLELRANGTGTIELQENTNITGDLSVTGNITLGGNLIIGNQEVDSVTVNADFTSDLLPNTSNTYDLGSSAKAWRNIYAGQLEVDGLKLDSTVISTIESNADIELRPNGTGSILVDQIRITDNLIEAINSGADLRLRGNSAGTIELQTNTAVTGNLTVTGDVTAATATFVEVNADILNVDGVTINDNVISTNASNANLELTPSGTGIVYINGTGAVRIPSGTTAERPVSGEFGMIRYNGQTNTIEAWNGAVFSSVGGGSLTDNDADTFATVETAGNDEDTFRFFIGNNSAISPVSKEVFTIERNTVTTDASLVVTGTISAPDATIPLINTGEINADQINVGSIEIDTNVIKTVDSNANLELRASGTGTIELLTDTGITGSLTVQDSITVSNKIRISDNIIENVNTNEDLIIRASGTGRVVIDGAGGEAGNIFATDPLLTLNTAQTGTNTYDMGLIMERGTDINVGFIWDESAEEFAAISTIEQGTVRGNVSITDYKNISSASIKLNSEIASKVTFTDANKVVRSLDSGRRAEVDGVMKFTTSAQAAIPTGTLAQRPNAPEEGTIRFNTTDKIFEGYADGAWRAMGFGAGTAPSYQGIVANGVSFEFLLDQTPLSSAGIIVAINGVVQEPEAAYTVDGNVLRFIDETSTVIAPDAGDRIDVRFLSMPAVNTTHTINLTGDGTTATFDIGYAIPNEESIIVFVNSIYQDTPVYSVSGSTITFDNEIPLDGDRINVVIFPSIVAPDLPTKTYVDNKIADDAIAYAIALG